jgi:transcriptional regulator with PAS, ATPase and Fis domain
MLGAIRTALRVADSGATVLLSGESGTGKELLARAIHRYSQRSLGPYVAVNCAALPEQLLESELFGHEKGAFTGATSQRLGRFERASGGTLFLDEIGDMSLSLQAKMLRALEEQEIERVGAERPTAIDVRVVAATNRDLKHDIGEGRFRADLYYRLAVVVVTLPPLRQRGDDVRLLAEHFLKLFACEHGRPVPTLTAEALQALYAYDWPGNVRQLRNAMEQALLLTEDLQIGLSLLPQEVTGRPPAQRQGSKYAVAHGQDRLITLPELERNHIRRVLAATSGHLGRAAEILGIHRNTLRRKLQELQLDD